MKIDIDAMITAKILKGGGDVTVESLSVTENGTYTAEAGKAYSPVTVNVSGSSGITKIAEKEFTVSTTSTSETDVGYVPIDAAYWTGDKIFLVTVVDKAGKRAGYHYGTISAFVNYQAKNDSENTVSYLPVFTIFDNDSSKYGTLGSKYGVYAGRWEKTDGIRISSRYNSSYGTIDGTFKVTVYQLDIPFLA